LFRAIARMTSVAQDLETNEILFPNRLEFLRGLPLVPDLYFLQRWTGFSRSGTAGDGTRRSIAIPASCS